MMSDESSVGVAGSGPVQGDAAIAAFLWTDVNAAAYTGTFVEVAESVSAVTEPDARGFPAVETAATVPRTSLLVPSPAVLTTEGPRVKSWVAPWPGVSPSVRLSAVTDADSKMSANVPSNAAVSTSVNRNEVVVAPSCTGPAPATPVEVSCDMTRTDFVDYDRKRDGQIAEPAEQHGQQWVNH